VTRDTGAPGDVVIPDGTGEDVLMGFFVVEPEASGRPDGIPSASGGSSCIFDTWLGDDVVSAHPLLLVTTELKEALLALSQPTGFSVVRARAIRSSFFERHSPDRRLPGFWSVVAYGRPGVDDLGIDTDGSFVASARVVEAMGRFCLEHATLTQYCASRVVERSRSYPLPR
jgi:hypothetical protein